VVEAKGKDKRGNGTAGATVTLTMDPNGDDTDVKVVTDLAITGKPAQFGRGVMQDVSDKLLGQFVACLEQRLGNSGDTAPAAPASPAAPAPASPVEPAAPSAPAAPAVPAEPTAPATPPPSARRSDDALDLGKTVLPVLVKSYWKPVVVAVVVILVLIWIFTR
jgi:uncharacterized protein